MGDRDDDTKDDEDRKAILARRNRLIAIAFSGLTGATGCYESHVTGEPPRPRRDGGVDAGAIPSVCLGAPLDAGFPGPCLEAPFDAGPGPCLGAPIDATPGPCLDAPLLDAGPTACLDFAPPDAGDDDPDPLDAAPGPCLSAPTPGS